MSGRALWRRIVEARWADTLANNLGVPGGRRQQEALDLDRLALWTQLWSLSGAGHAPPSQQDYRHLAMKIKAMSIREHKRQVEACVQKQITNIATTLHEHLLQAGDEVLAAQAMEAAHSHLTSMDEDEKPTQQGRSTSSSPHHHQQQHQQHQQHQQQQQPDAASQPSTSGRHLPLSQVLEQHLGYSLRVGPSSIQHPSAGQGVFLSGSARVGSVVALLPGLVYGRTQLSRMPNYPQVSLGNDFLSSRYDMTIIDSLPWKQALDRERPGGTSAESSTSSGSDDSSSTSNGGAGGASSSSSSSQGSGAAQQSSHERYARWVLGALETRHPLAWGHMINHPAPGMHPNVLETAWDMELDLSQQPAWLRAYLPVAPGLDLDLAGGDAAQALLSPPDMKDQGKLTVRGLALVATRGIKDGEELLQNYRLNPHATRPAWYTSYDVEEEHRRWAPLSFAKLL